MTRICCNCKHWETDYPDKVKQAYCGQHDVFSHFGSTCGRFEPREEIYKEPAKVVKEHEIRYNELDKSYEFVDGDGLAHSVGHAADYGFAFVHVLKDREIPNGQAICWRNEANTRWSMWSNEDCYIPRMAEKVRRLV